jgi:methionyl-tRNA synthetase
MLLLINKKMTQKFYITTPIYYVNDIPHIGHAYCTLATDTIARYWRTKLGAENVHFLTGTDENSQKTVDAAQKNNQEVYAYLDDMAKNWRETWEKIGISFDDFIRTTEERHKNTVNEIFQTIFDNGDIYKGIYKGKYCTGCETFLKDADLDENGHCPAHKKAPQELEEENYFFRLSKYEDILLELFEKNPDFLLPQSRQNEILSFIKSGLEDISVSRETAEFGISLPMDNKHKVYVWFDALLNYISAIKNTNKTDFWDNVHHIIGKDITKFHCVIWPAMLIAAGIKPPQTVYAHGFFTINGTKMSKSLGNVVSPLDLSDKYGNDALRIGLLNSFEFGNDGDFSLDN